MNYNAKPVINEAEAKRHLARLQDSGHDYTIKEMVDAVFNLHLVRGLVYSEAKAFLVVRQHYKDFPMDGQEVSNG